MTDTVKHERDDRIVDSRRLEDKIDALKVSILALTDKVQALMFSRILWPALSMTLIALYLGGIVAAGYIAFIVKLR